jgi:hypothetical protein
MTRPRFAQNFLQPVIINHGWTRFVYIANFPRGMMELVVGAHLKVLGLLGVSFISKNYE